MTIMTRQRVALAICGALVVTLAGATSASAHGAPFTIAAGSAPPGTTVAVTKSSTGSSPQVLFKDTSTGITLSCSGSTIKGTVTTGASSGAPVVSLDGAKVVFSGCTGPAGLQFKITGYGTWNINIADSTNGVNTGTVTNIRAHVQGTAGPACGFDVGANSGTFSSSSTATVASGSLAGTYTNSTQNVTVPASAPGALGAWNVKGGTGGTSQYCVSPSVLRQGDKLSVSATWKLTADVSAYNPVAVT